MTDNSRRGMTPQDARRIIDSARFTERAYKNDPPRPRRAPAFSNPGVKYAVVGPGGIGAFNAGTSTPGQGEVTLQTYEGPGKPLVATATKVVVSNAGTAIAGGKVINVAFGDGGWHTVVVPC